MGLGSLSDVDGTLFTVDLIGQVIGDFSPIFGHEQQIIPSIGPYLFRHGWPWPGDRHCEGWNPNMDAGESQC